MILPQKVILKSNTSNYVLDCRICNCIKQLNGHGITQMVVRSYLIFLSMFFFSFEGPTAPAGRMESVHANQDVTILNIHQRITALTVGRLDPKSNRDTLLIGTPTNLLAYDVERNADVFHKDVPDGVNALVVGQLGMNVEAAT